MEEKEENIKKEEKEREDNEKHEEEKEYRDEKELIEERKKKFLNFLRGKTAWVFYIILAIIAYISFKIRTSNLHGLRDVTTGHWTLGPDLDPFLFLRWAQYIVQHGSLMAVDTMRNVPLGLNTAGEMKFISYGIVYLYKFLHFFSDKVTVEYAAVIFPAIFFVFTCIAFFLLVKKIFEGHFKENKKIPYIIALIATAFLAVLPSLLPRTIAGIPEKESAGFFFIFLSFYLFLCAWKTSNMKKAAIFGILAGAATALMGHTWGGIVYIFMTIAIAVFIAFIFGKVGKKEFLAYSLWVISFIIFLLPFTKRYTFMDLATSTSSGLAFIVLLFLIVDFIIFKTKISNIKKIKKLENKKIPRQIISLIVSAVIVLVLSIIVFGFSFIPNFISSSIESLTKPYADRLSFTVAENRQPYFSEWKGSFGPIFKNIPLFFWLFFIGSIFLFYETFRKIKIKERIILTISYIIFLFALIFSRSSQNSVLNGVSGLSKTVYFGGILLLIGGFIYVYYKYNKEEKLYLFKKIDFSYIFLFVFFFLAIVGARSAIRLIMVLGPPASIIISFFVVDITRKAIKSKEELSKILFWIITILVILTTFYTLYIYYQTTSAQARGFIPSAYTHQWQKAMVWVRENTSENAVFSHWWDYGYWIQTIGKRATVLDGGNFISYWNHLMGRHVLTGSNRTSALEFLYTHNATHLLIDSTDIGKYPAFSNIGSDENYDRYSWIPTFLLNEQAIQETRNETIYLYQGGVAVDEDIIWKENNQQILLPSGKAGIGAIKLRMQNDEVKGAEAIFVYQGKQTTIPLKYVYYNNKLHEFNKNNNIDVNNDEDKSFEALEAGIFIFPRIIEQGGGARVNNLGAALYLSRRTVNSFLARLYLFNEGKDKDENFELVYAENNLIIDNLRNQGLEIGDFAFYNGLHGPIKIWKIKYLKDVKINPDYLKTSYPAEKLWKVV